MVNVLSFLRAFNLIEGNEYAGYFLQSVEGKRKTIRRHEYQFDIVLVFTNPGTGIYLQLLEDLQADQPRSQVVHDVSCEYFGVLEPLVYQNIMQNGDSMVVFTQTGHAYRR